MSRLRLAVVSAALAALASIPVHAQVLGSLQGRITDTTTSAVVPHATVELTNGGTNIRQTAITSGSGVYTFTNLTTGTYTVLVTASGFTTLNREGITISIGKTIGLDLALALGSDRQTVTVTGDAPLLQAATSNIQTNIPGRTVVALPLNNRNFIQLTTLAPGVQLPPGTLLPRINGGRPRTNEYLYDGISALQPEPGQVVFFPIVDDIAEFTVEANNVPAEFGRFNGGVVNVATRGGTNTVHGSLYEFFRNEDLNARNYFSPASLSPTKPKFRRHLYGATLGGPILRDRLFVFAGYQGIRQLVGRTVTSTVPTAAQRTGQFASAVYDPARATITGGKTIRQQFAGNLIDPARWDPAARALLARIPAPTTTGAANNYSRTANDADHQNQFDVRIDGAVGQHDRAFGRYSYFSDVEQPITFFPDGSGASVGSVLGTGGVTGLSNILGQQGVFNETHIFTPSLLNELRVGYTRRGNTSGGPALGTTTSAALAIPGIPTNAAFNNALPIITFTGLQQLGPPASTNAVFSTIVTEFVDNFVYTHGRHAFKFGGDIRWYQLNSVAPPNPTGSFAFTVTGTDTQTLTGTTTTGGNAFASFLLGQVDTFSIDLQRAKIRPRDHIQEYFFQDDFRASDRLSLNLGVRYTLHSPSTEANNQGAVFNLATQQLDYLGPQTGQPGNSRPARQLHYDNVAPRLGFTYMLQPKTVLRSGFGIVFIDQSGITTPFTTPQFPFIQNVQQATQDNLTSPFTLSNGPTVTPVALTANAGLGQSVYTAKRSAGSGYIEQWNLAFQRTLTSNLSVDVAYVGSHIVHVGIPDSNLNQLTAAQLAQGPSLLTRVANPNAGAVPGTLGTATIAQAQLLKPFPRFQNVATYRNNSGTTNYNAIEAKAEQRVSNGLYLLLAYTHSKLIDDASSVFSSTVLSSPNTSSLVAADTFRPYLERDSSSGDIPNVATGAITYDLPLLHRSGSLIGTLLGGWAANAIVTVQSGMPVTVTQATNSNSFAGISTQRPNRIANPSLDPQLRTPARFFNTAAFATAPQFTFGSASRNPVRGPAYRDLDFALVKHTRLVRTGGELATLEFRAEVFNITNAPAFSQPNGSFGAAAFGSITSTTTDPRVVQFALRLQR